ncbi:MAG: Holliday junction branch migration protein RuvA [Planctomycetota bacterium]
MFEYLIGQIKEKTPTHLVLQVGGLAFKLLIPVSTYEKLPVAGEVKIYVSLDFQNSLQGINVRLYGFISTLERQFFTLLSTVNRIGPTTALKIISGTSIAEFRQAVISENIEFISRIKGVGEKTAQRIVLELKETFKTWVIGEGKDGLAQKRGVDLITDAVLALVSLGYPRATAEKAVRSALQKIRPDSPLEDLIKMSLQQT